MMGKFKVGDKVKIRDDLIWDHYYGDIRCSSKRLECKGKIGEITKIAKTGSYFIHNHWFSEEMLESCESKDTTKFKVGDKVRVKYPIFGKNSQYRGDILTIKKVEDTIFDDYSYSVIENDVIWDYYLLEPTEEETFNYIDDTMDTSYRPVVDKGDSIDAMVYGIWEYEKEEKDMNKVLDLWYRRNKERIYKKYKELEDTYVEEHYEVVKQYNELIEKFEKDLEEFCTKYSDVKVDDDFVICANADCNVYKYVIDKSVIRHDAEMTYKEDTSKEYKELEMKHEDINALLSMSDDLEYQQSVLIEYGIIDKKTKRVINEDNSK